MMVSLDWNSEHGPCNTQLCVLEQKEYGSNLTLSEEAYDDSVIYNCTELTSVAEFSKAVQTGQSPEQSAKRNGRKHLF